MWDCCWGLRGDLEVCGIVLEAGASFSGLGYHLGGMWKILGRGQLPGANQGVGTDFSTLPLTPPLLLVLRSPGG